MAEICRNLYKKRPEQVDDRLVYNIVRDSKDPGALGVFASGGRLPPPRPANELLRKFNGPVLVAQGALDPLNDAKGRAELLRTCYDKTVVRLIEAGHCPHVSTYHSTSRGKDHTQPRSRVAPVRGVSLSGRRPGERVQGHRRIHPKPKAGRRGASAGHSASARSRRCIATRTDRPAS